MQKLALVLLSLIQLVVEVLKAVSTIGKYTNDLNDPFFPEN